MRKKRSLLIIIIIGICLSLCISIYSLTIPQKTLKINQKNYINSNNVQLDYSKAYNPSQIRHAYGLDLIDVQGENQKIAVIVPYGSPTIKNDLKIFNKHFGLNEADLKVFYPQGEPTIQVPSWALETSLDVEWIHSLSPKASIFLVVSKSDSIDDIIKSIDFSVNSGANIISMSWSIEEFKDELSYENHFSNKNITFIASAGDNGNKVNWPAVSPNVLAVGGTTFSLNLKGDLIKPEVSWSESSYGISKYMTEPNYQRNYGLNTNGYRAVPDVSFYADKSKGVWIYYSADKHTNISGWTTSAGTSLGAPAWAAFLSLVNESRKSPINNIHNILYKISNSKNTSPNFRNIINSTNSNSHIKSYNYTTGLGSPFTNNLYKTLTSEN